MTTRADRITEYMEDWHGGFFWLRTTKRAGLEQRLAENVVSFHLNGSDDAERIKSYTRTIVDMFDAGTLDLKTAEGGYWYFELPNRILGEDS